jgi:hypothetical protein
VIASHVHQALAQVRKLQEWVLAKRLFRGYSGKARIISGFAPLAAAMVLSSSLVPRTPLAHLIGWAVVLAFGLIVNYVSLLYWFLFDAEVRRRPAMLKPAVDAVPALAIGAVFSAALILRESHDLLFGAWMCCYGLAQVAYRQSLPDGIYRVGLGYMVCGVCCLLSPRVSFLNPWPMGIVFFLGEMAGGRVLIRNRKADVHDLHTERTGSADAGNEKDDET